MSNEIRITVAALLITAGTAALPAADKASGGGNRILMEQKAGELKELNEQLHKKLGSLEKYNNKSIYVKVRFLPSVGNSRPFKIEKISLEEIPGPKAENKDRNTAIVKCRVVKNELPEEDDGSKYKLDLSYVLPPPDKEEKQKKQEK